MNDELSNVILSEIRELRKEQARMAERLGQIHVDIAVLKVKTGLIGSVFGAVGGLLPLMAEKLLSHLK